MTPRRRKPTATATADAARQRLDLLGTTDAGEAVYLPDDAVTQGFALLAKRRSGKSTTAGVMEEIFCERGDPFVVVDCVGAHWGITRKDNRGKPGAASGYEVLIVGGLYADVPLQENAAPALAEIIVETDINCIIDLSEERSMRGQQMFVAAFANELHALNKTPRHIFIEEAHLFVPQQLEWEGQREARSALSRMIRTGGQKGIGFTLISQRNAEVAKSVLEQIDNLIAMRSFGPRDLSAVEGWLKHNMKDKAEVDEVLRSIPSLAPGQAWLCSPDWMHQVTRLQVRHRRTYHAGRTPKRGETPVAVHRLALPRVIEKFRKAAETHHFAVVEQKDLKAQVVDLQRQLKARPVAPVLAAAVPSEELIERRVAAATLTLQREHVAALRAASGYTDRLERAIKTTADELTTTAERLRAASAAVNGRAPAPEMSRPLSPPPRHEPKATPPPRMSPAMSLPSSEEPVLEGDLVQPEQRVLNAIAWMESLGVTEPAQQAVCFLAGYTWGGGYFKPRSALKAKSLVEYAPGNRISMTDAGRARAVVPGAALTLSELHRRVLERLEGPERRLLAPLLEAYPEPIEQERLCETAGYTWGGGYFKPRGRLKSWGLVEYLRGSTPGRSIAAAAPLFPEGLA